MCFDAIRENKIPSKISESTVYAGSFMRWSRKFHHGGGGGGPETFLLNCVNTFWPSQTVI